MSDKNFLKGDLKHRPYLETSYPIAEEIVQLLSSKKISYAEACEALDIAKKGIETKIISD